MRYTLGLLVAILIGFGLQVQSASAQASRTWVSGVGDDANPCSRTAPCKTFAGAISKTATGGEISVLDPGGFGTVTITKSISIVADGDLGSILGSGTTAVNVSLPTANDKVVLKGLEMDGTGTGFSGVTMRGAGKLTVVDCIIRNFVTSAGIDVKGSAGARVFVDRSTILNNGTGVKIEGASGAANTVFLSRSTVDASTNAGVDVANANTVVLSDNVLSGSGDLDLKTATGGTSVSYGNNLIRSGTPTQTQMLK